MISKNTNWLYRCTAAQMRVQRCPDRDGRTLTSRSDISEFLPL